MQTKLFDHYFDDTHCALRAEIRKFVQAEISPRAQEFEENESFDYELYAKVGGLGFLGVSYPSAYGGGDGDIFHSVVMTEELIRGGSTGTAVGLGSLQIALPPILKLGSEEQKERFIPPVIKGEKVAALAVTEPGTGSDVAGVRTKAEKTDQGFVINGSKTFITSGVRADYLMVLARTSEDPHFGLTFFLVEKDFPGVSVSRALKKTGWHASDTAELFFENVTVPESHRIGQLGSGFLALMNNFETERLLLAIQGNTLAEMAFDEAAKYSQERQAFGRPIGKFQVNKHKLAEMATKIQTSKAMTYLVADAMNQGKAYMQDVAMAKNHAAQMACDVTWEAQQIFGGMGYMRECLVERLFRDARILPIGGGTHEIMNEIIAKNLGL